MADEIPTVTSLIERVNKLGSPAAFQAVWDGDSGGWMAIVQVVHAAGTGYRASDLAILRLGSDLRLFRGGVPLWPEARVARELGNALATHFGVTFWFPSPDEPDDDCPAWWQRDRAHACEGCGKLILPRDTPHLPDEVCYACHLKRQAHAQLRREEPSP